MLENIANRIFQNWKTTALSLALFGGLAYLGANKIVTWEVLSGYFTTAAMFLFVKDPKKANSLRA